MYSFDVKSLFTNVPLDGRIEICINALYHDLNSVAHAVEKSMLRKLLLKATREVKFSFVDNMFSHVDGIAMGSPLGPTLANIFVGCHESLLTSALDTLPMVYLRYIDDCFAILKRKA